MKLIVIFLVGVIILSGCTVGERTQTFKSSYGEAVLWEMGEQNLIFSLDERLELRVLSEDYYFQEGGNFVYLDSLLCQPHDCSRLTPYYEYYPKAICLVCDYNASNRQEIEK